MEANKQHHGSASLSSQNSDSYNEDGAVLDNDKGGGTHGSGFAGEDRSQSQPVAEFLYQLTKMLTDDNNEIIEWSDGRIKVHYPERLEGEVLHKYFRHSKFASFQRQLNYFGFRKIAGKGKMSPCSYVNENATSDIRSLLLIKRKTNGSAARKAALQQQAAAVVSQNNAAAVNPYAGFMGLAGGLSGALGNAGMLSNPQALSSAMALLSENALRAGINAQFPNLQQQQQQGNSGNHLNLLALQAQQQQQQQALQKQFLEQQQQTMHQNQLRNEAFADMQKSKNTVSFAANVKQEEQQNNAAPSLEQLHAHLMALHEQQQLAQNHQLQNNSNPATAALLAASAASSQHHQFNRATAALTALGGGNNMPATAAMEHSSPSAGNLFESAVNLKSLLEEHAAQTKSTADAQAAAQFLRSQASLGGAAGFTGDTSMSFGNLLGSSNRLSSLMSLNSFLGSASREVSLVDIAAFRDQLAAAHSAANIGEMANKLRAQNKNNN